MDQRLCVIGPGLIGCSFTLALKAAGFRGHVVGCSRSQETLDTAQSNGAIDSGNTDVAVAVEDADVVMVTVPMMATAKVLLDMRDALKPEAIITDGGSVKGSFIAEARDILADHLDRFVPGHPIAGREKSGAAAATADLFEKKRVLLTPLAETSSEATALVSKLWSMTGAAVETLDPVVHDRVLAATSHLPHVVAYALVDLLATKQEHEEIFRYAAGGFADFTRIASSDPAMWRDICLTNGTEIDRVVGDLVKNLQRFQTMVQQRDGEALFDAFGRAKETRDKHTVKLSHTPEPASVSDSS